MALKKRQQPLQAAPGYRSPETTLPLEQPAMQQGRGAQDSLVHSSACTAAREAEACALSRWRWSTSKSISSSGVMKASSSSSAKSIWSRQLLSGPRLHFIGPVPLQTQAQQRLSNAQVHTCPQGDCCQRNKVLPEWGCLPGQLRERSGGVSHYLQPDTPENALQLLADCRLPALFVGQGLADKTAATDIHAVLLLSQSRPAGGQPGKHYSLAGQPTCGLHGLRQSTLQSCILSFRGIHLHSSTKALPAAWCLVS